MKEQDYINVIQAFIDGKEIEGRRITTSTTYQRDWGPAPSPCWNFYDYEYRVATKHKIGNVYKISGNKCLLCHAGGNYVGLISLNGDGNRWKDFVCVLQINNITTEEFKRMIGDNDWEKV